MTSSANTGGNNQAKQARRGSFSLFLPHSYDLPLNISGEKWAFTKYLIKGCIYIIKVGPCEIK